ncbi:MAG: hypothetical protein R2760_06730 [Chitinophagales bacterium]
MIENQLPIITKEELTHINIFGAKVHNLKNIDVPAFQEPIDIIR